MKSEEFVRQVETYSNGIVVFTALQSLGYCYSFGTNPMFNCLVKTAKHLAAGLTGAFVITAVLAAAGVTYLGRVIQHLAGEFAPIVKRIYLGKLIAVLLFGSLPAILTLGYGVFGPDNDKAECKTKLAAAGISK
jgi:hypothetical protein